jgi:hypothetical protein
MPHQLGSPQIRKAYRYLVKAEEDERTFTAEDLMTASGWKASNTKTNISKKLRPYLRDVAGGYVCVGLKKLDEDIFCRICSQISTLTQDPERPRLAPKTEGLVNKARDAALAAVQHYNNPTSVFRSGNYIMLMIVAYTALFHALFERDGEEYIYRDASGSPKMRDGETLYWDLARCLKHFSTKYAQNYNKLEAECIKSNLEMMIPVRNKIEHRFMPQLDAQIAGHCQSMLMNFERILISEFTSYYALSPSLTLAMQFSTTRSEETIRTMRRFQSDEYEDLKTLINDFQTALPDEIVANPAFAFRVWLIPKSANHARSSDMSMEFVPIDNLTAEELEQLQKAVVAIKTREKPVDYSEICTLYESEVLTHIKKALGAQVQFAGEMKALTGAMIRQIIKAHNIESPSKMYYRPKKAGARAMYSVDFAAWIIAEYNKDPEFFYKTWRKAK